MTIKFNAPWHHLKHAWVGASYRPEFYSTIKNSYIRDSLQTIAQETEEDYLNLISVLSQFSVKVERPVINSDLTILDYVNDVGRLDYVSANSFTLLPRPPMQPRDSMLIVGNTMLEANKELFAPKGSGVGTPRPGGKQQKGEPERKLRLPSI